MNNIRLLAFDIDGTFTIQKDEVLDSTREALTKISNTIELVPCTGRGVYRLVEEVIQNEKVRYVIGANGAVVYDRKLDKQLVCFPLQKSVALDIINTCIDREYFVYYHRNDHTCTHYASCKDKQTYQTNYEPIFQKKYEDAVKKDLISFISNDNKEVLKLGIRLKDKIETLKFQKELFNKYLDIQVFHVDDNSLEVTDIHASKHQALSWLCNYLQIPSTQVFAIGDSGNDIGMLKFAGISVAMGNAKDEVKQSAKYTTDFNYNDGFAKAIRNIESVIHDEDI